MVKKVPLKKNTKRAAKKISFQKIRMINSKKFLNRNNLKNQHYYSNICTSNPKSKQKEEINLDLVSKTFFDAQSSIKVQCCFCDKNLTNNIKILLEPFPKNINTPQKKYSLPFELICLKCLVVKLKNNFKEIKSLNYFNDSIPHQYTHYRIINKMKEPIFTMDWSFGDEIKLLGALERLGVGNWEEIANITGKGKFECESHYYTFYYKSNNDFLPDDKLIILNTNNKCSKNISLSNKKQETLYTDKIKQNIGYIPFSENNKSNRSLSKNNIKK